MGYKEHYPERYQGAVGTSSYQEHGRELSPSQMLLSTSQQINNPMQ